MQEQRSKTAPSEDSSHAVVGSFTDRKTAELAAHAALNAGFTVQFTDRTTVKVVAAQAPLTAEAEGILAAYGATNLPDVRAEIDAEGRDSGPKDIRADGGGTFELVEEELEPHKDSIVDGEVRIRKNIVHETVTIEVPVEREELVFERVAVQRRPEDQADDDHVPSDPLVEAFSARLRGMQPGEVVRIPIVEEQVVVHKQPVVKSELAIGKRLVREVRHFSDTVRREVAKVERRGDARVVTELEGRS